jgi:hypothetical protein
VKTGWHQWTLLDRFRRSVRRSSAIAQAFIISRLLAADHDLHLWVADLQPFVEANSAINGFANDKNPNHIQNARVNANAVAMQ